MISRTRLRNIFNVAPTLRGAALIGVLSLTWLLSGNYNGFIAAFSISCLALIIIVIDLFTLPSYKNITIDIEAPNILGVREDGDGIWTVKSSWTGSLKFKISPAFSDHINSDISNSVYKVEPYSSHSRSFKIYGVRRGAEKLGETGVTILSKLGLVQRSFIYSHSATISVVPAFSENIRYRMTAIQHNMKALGQRAIKRRGVSTSFNNLRDYSIGDDPRNIDWKASARRRKLITKEFTVEQGQNVLIAIDAGRMMTQLSDGLERFEYALSSALTLAEVAVASGDNVGVMVFNEKVRHFIPPGKGSSSIMRIRDIFTRSSATLVESDYSAAFNTIAVYQKKRSLIVLFTDVVDIRASRSIIAQTTHSLRKHLPILIAIKNEDVHSAARSMVQDDELRHFEAAAAEEMLSAREAALTKVKLAGVPTIDTSPRAMTSLLIQKYLEIKDRGLL